MFDLFNRFLVGFVLKMVSSIGLGAERLKAIRLGRVKYGMLLEYLKEYTLKMKDKVLKHYNGLPLVMHTLAAAIHKQILGIK